jgi:hypothetical protein
MRRSDIMMLSQDRLPAEPGVFQWIAVMIAACFLVAPDAFGAADAVSQQLAEQAAQYRAEVPKTIIELQQFRQSESSIVDGGKGRKGKATLINLNPRINAWFLLRLDWEDGVHAAYHLENANPAGQLLHLGDANPHGIQISAEGRSVNCDLWLAATTSPLDEAQRSGLPYAPLCEGRLFLRNRVAGSFSNLERVTQFLRDHVWGGEAIIGFVKKEFFRDQFAEKGTTAVGPMAPGQPAHPDRPLPALLEPGKADHLVPGDLGIDLTEPASNLSAGQWYPATGLSGVYVSFVQPKAVSARILGSHPSRVNGLDAVEAGAMDYLIAFDMAEFNLGFVIGTDHPRVDWSSQATRAAHGNLPGPDGIGTVAPLVTNGMISPPLAARTVATFAGGFKRQHGGFGYGAFAEQNHGSHYGFIEQGTVFSKLVPGLSTLYVLDDETINMNTWSSQNDQLLARIKFARQNGVPLAEYDPGSDIPVPGPLVNQWGPGNWSGSADAKLRSLRAGACFQETPARRFLIYGYFSTATPSAMARVFQAYRCHYAMHLDMNAPELTYLAVYVHKGAELMVEHLVKAMAEFDKKADGQAAPKFLGFPDNRDFFYLVRREMPR